MKNFDDEILAMIRKMASHCDGHSSYVLAGNKEYFSYVIMDEPEYTLVNGESNGNIVTDTKIIPPREVIDLVADHLRSHLHTFSTKEFPWQNSKPLTCDHDLLIYLQTKRASYDAKTPEERAKLWEIGGDLTAFVQRGEAAEIKAWASEVFFKVETHDDNHHTVFYKDEAVALTLTPAARQNYLGVHLLSKTRPISLPWFSSLALSRSLFGKIGKQTVSAPCMVSHRPDDLYFIAAQDEGLIDAKILGWA